MLSRRFSLIHDQYETLSISVETMLEIHFQLFKYATSDSGTFRQQDIVCHGFHMKVCPYPTIKQYQQKV